MNVTYRIDQQLGRVRGLARAGGRMSRAYGAQLCYLFLGRRPGVAPGWYEMTPLASAGAFNGKCQNSSLLPKWEERDLP